MSRQTEIDDARAQALFDLQTRGLTAAINALIDVAEDREAPANSRAAAGSALVRANGLFATSAAAATPKELHEMTADELKALTAQLERDRAALLRQMQDGEDVFD
jgi:hypothetical protein